MLPNVDAALQSKWLWLVARLLLIVVFVSSGLAKLLAFEDGLAEMRQAGLEPAWFFNVAVAVTLLAGSVLILFDKHTWLAAGTLAVFLLLTILIVHRFWDLPEGRAQIALYFALEHISIVGGLLMAAIASSLRASMTTEPTLQPHGRQIAPNA